MTEPTHDDPADEAIDEGRDISDVGLPGPDDPPADDQQGVDPAALDEVFPAAE